MAKTYTVMQGDTLVHIAARECNNSITWQQIAADNNISNPNLIQVGQQLILNCADNAPSPAPIPTPPQVPAAYTLGVDVSYAQVNVDWASLRNQGVRFGLVKVSDGATTTDNQFHKNWNGMRVNGVLRGAYHYFRALQDAQAQVNLVMSLVSLEATDLPLFVDVESTGNTSASNSQWASGLTLWLQQIEQRTGRTPIIYTRANYWNGLNLPNLSHYPLWVANWRSPTSQPIMPTAGLSGRSGSIPARTIHRLRIRVWAQALIWISSTARITICCPSSSPTPNASAIQPLNPHQEQRRSEQRRCSTSPRRHSHIDLPPLIEFAREQGTFAA